MENGTQSVVVEDGRLTIYHDNRKMVRRLNLKGVFVLIPVAALMFLFFGWLRTLDPHDAGLQTMCSIYPWAIAAFYVFIWIGMLALTSRRRSPIVVLSKDGITIDSVFTRVGFIGWREIRDVWTYNLMYRYVGISLQDPDAVYRRIGRKRALLARLNARVAPIYSLFRVRVAPINIPQEYLPISADELLAHIQAYRKQVTGAWFDSADSQSPQPGVWPPPPQPSQS